jgi:hypothetical protein
LSRSSVQRIRKEVFMPMLLKGDDEKEFELALIPERLTDTQDGFGDAAALTASFRVATADDSWEETSPCLNTFEFRNLAEWLTAVADGTGDEAEMELLEPELRFAVVKDHGDRLTLRIGFQLEGRPEEFEVDSPTDVRRVDLRLTRERIRTAAEQLRADLAAIGEGGKDDIDGAEDLGQVRPADDDLNMIDRIEPDPPMGAGDGVDNAGER